MDQRERTRGHQRLHRGAMVARHSRERTGGRASRQEERGAPGGARRNRWGTGAPVATATAVV